MRPSAEAGNEERGQDLFTPTLEGHAARDSRRKPWRLGSLFYVAFFGGPLAVGSIAWLNARRLGLDGRRQAAVVALGVIGVLVGLAVVSAMSATTRDLNLVFRLISVGAYGLMFVIERPADRVHSFYRGGDSAYDSLVIPGLLACVVFAFVNVGLITAVQN